MKRLISTIGFMVLLLLPIGFNGCTSGKADGSVLRNELVELRFGRWGSIQRLTERATQTDFVHGNPTGPLWIIELREDSSYGGNLTEVDSTQSNCIATIEDNRLTLRWDGLTIKSKPSIRTEPNALNVQVDVCLEGRFSYWRLSVENKSSAWGLWTITFPVIEGLGTGEDDHCIWPQRGGQYIDNLTTEDGTEYWGGYPSGTATMQFIVLGTQAASLYLGVHDPLPCSKEFRLETHGRRGATYQVIHFPDHMGEPGHDFTLPYDVVIGILDGDWIDACKVYRKWLTTEADYCPPPIAEQANQPKWFQDIAVWLHANGPAWGPENQQLLDWAEYIGQPIAIHWYNWHQYVFDQYYPEYFPAKPRAKEWAQLFQDAGIRMVPYINGYLWDIDSESYYAERAARSAIRKPIVRDRGRARSAGKGVGEPYLCPCNRHTLAYMCPVTEQWQEKVAGLCEKIVTELGTDGVYLDLIGITEPPLCFSKEHGHSGYAGRITVEGAQRLVEKCRERMQAVNPETILATEGRSAAFPFDAGLSFSDTQFGSSLVPMFDYVWSGYKTSFGRIASAQPDGLPQQFAQCFVWGEQMGWDGLWSSDAMQPGTAYGAYLKELARVFTEEAKRFTRYGEMLHPVKVLNEVPMRSTVWGQRSQGADYVTMPVVLHSLWRVPDGTLGLVVTNWTDTAQLIRFDIGEGLQLDMAPFSARVIELRQGDTSD